MNELSGIIRNPRPLRTRGTNVPYSVVIGDFTRDGMPDFAVVNYLRTGSVEILLGNGDVGKMGQGQMSQPPRGRVRVRRLLLGKHFQHYRCDVIVWRDAAGEG